MPNIIFKLEHQFTLYLQRAGVTRADLPPVQYMEMRRAFYGGLGQMFFLITQDVGKLKERAQMETLQSLMDQVGEYWDKEAKSHKDGRIEYVPQARSKCDKCAWEGRVDETIKPEPDDPDNRVKCPKCGGKEFYFPEW